MTRRSLLFAAFCLAATLNRVAADEPNLAAWLEKPILAPNQTLTETQEYIEGRLPPMPMPEQPAEWEQYAARVRRDVLDRVVFRGEAAKWRDAETKVEWFDTIDGGPGYHIMKLRYEALPGLWIPALLYVPENLEGKVPAIMNVNGHDRNGKAAKYKQIRCINLAKRGMLVLNPEWLGMGQLSGDGYRHGRMNQLDLCGTSGLAPFYLAMSRGLDILLANEHTDPERVAVSGLSGGGWQTITISSLDPRVKLCNPVAGYSSFRTRVRNFQDLGDSEQTPCDLATVADYEHLTAILAPRPALLTYNFKDDCCFAADHALPPLVDAARPVYRIFGKELSLRSHVNHHPGTHNFEIENREAFYRMVGDFFYPDKKDFDSQEIVCEDEVKSADQLKVDLPDGNEDFHTLAVKLAAGLPRTPARPADEPGAAKWRAERRTRLAEIVRAKNYNVTAERVASEESAGVTCTFWRLKVGDAWSVPAVELVRGDPKETAIVVCDDGRKAAGPAIERLLASGVRVIAVDPFYFGECKFAQRDYLFALLIATIGDRSLGIQASQLAAVARWCNQSHIKPATVTTIGPRSSIISLAAANLEPDRIGRLELQGATLNLSDVIAKNHSFEQTPELFCFGLLHEFDSKQLAESAGIEVRKQTD
jgi:dienelactone hydrolase